MTDNSPIPSQVLEHLVALSRLLGEMRPLDELLGRLVESACQLTRSEAASILIYEPETGLLRFAAAPLTQRDYLKRVRVPLDNSVAGAAYLQGTPITVQDAHNEPLIFREVDQILSFATRNLLAVPLRFAGQTLGVMEAVNKQDDAHYTEEDVTLLETLATYAATALSQAALQREVTLARRDIQSLERLKADFTAIASHELRTPLGLVLGHAAVLKEMLPDPQYAAQIDGVLEGAARLGRIIESLSHLDMPSASRRNLELQPLDVGELVKGTCRMFEETARLKGIALGLQIPRSSLVVQADADKIALVVGNLVENALNYTPRGGHVVVTVERLPAPPSGDGGAVKVSVLDDGVGIPARDLPRVFDRFFQVESHATRQHGGLGLGLPVAKTMVELHGGQIWAESIEGRGSKFSFLLPVQSTELAR